MIGRWCCVWVFFGSSMWSTEDNSGHPGMYPLFPVSESAVQIPSMRERSGLHRGGATGFVAWLSREIGAGEGRCLLSDQPLHFPNGQSQALADWVLLSPSFFYSLATKGSLPARGEQHDSATDLPSKSRNTANSTQSWAASPVILRSSNTNIT